MAQYDVFANPDDARHGALPFLVVIQSAQLDHHSTRLVMPHLCAPFPARLLRAPHASLLAESAVLLAALDSVASGV